MSIPTTATVHPTLVRLFHHRWAVPVVGEIWALDGAKFVTLQRRLGIGRESLRFILRALIDAKLVMRNPGYGHPLRPEYLLDEWGRWIGRDCHGLVTSLRGAEIHEIGLRKWSMPVVAALGTEEGRFSEIKEAVGGVTSRALASALRDLGAAGLLEREVLPTFPPAALYRLTPQGVEALAYVEGIHDAIRGRPGQRG